VFPKRLFISWTLATLIFGGAPYLFAKDSSQPLNLQDTPISKKEKKNFLCLGYRFETEHLRAPDGRLVTKKEYAKDTTQAFNYKLWIKSFLSKQKPSMSPDQEESEIGRRLVSANCRLDPETAHVLSPRYQTLDTIEGECLFSSRFGARSNHPSKTSIESAAAEIGYTRKICAQFPESCSKQKELLEKKLNLFAAHDPGFKKFLQSDPHFQADILGSYQKLRARFDGEETPSSLINRALGKYSSGLKALPAYNAQENSLSRVLQKQVIAKLSQNPEGRKVLERLKVNGKITLPPIFVLETDNSGAFYQWTPQGDRVVLNADYVFEGLPNKKQLISDFRAGNRYLAKHPQALKGYLEKYDNILAHEFTHTWQQRKDHLQSLAYANLLPGRDYIEEEQEAFLTEARYLSYAALKNPKKAMEHPYFYGRVLPFVHNPRQFSDSVNDLYTSLYGSSVATFKTAEKIMREQRESDQNLSAPPPEAIILTAPLSAASAQKMVQWLKAKLSLAGDSKEFSKASVLGRDYDARIGRLISDSNDLIQKTTRKLEEWDTAQAFQARNLYIKIGYLTDAMRYGKNMAPEIASLLKKQGLSREQAANGMLHLAKNMALRNHGAASSAQALKIRNLIEGVQYLRASSSNEMSSQIDWTLSCGIYGENCERLKK
jgi:hypothetical protein